MAINAFCKFFGISFSLTSSLFSLGSCICSIIFPLSSTITELSERFPVAFVGSISGAFLIIPITIPNTAPPTIIIATRIKSRLTLKTTFLFFFALLFFLSVLFFESTFPFISVFFFSFDIFTSALMH